MVRERKHSLPERLVYGQDAPALDRVRRYLPWLLAALVGLALATYLEQWEVVSLLTPVASWLGGQTWPAIQRVLREHRDSDRPPSRDTDPAPPPELGRRNRRKALVLEDTDRGDDDIDTTYHELPDTPAETPGSKERDRGR